LSSGGLQTAIVLWRNTDGALECAAASASQTRFSWLMNLLGIVASSVLGERQIPADGRRPLCVPRAPNCGV